MKNKGQIRHICMISDDNYVMPTCVAIQSLIESKKEGTYSIHIIASSLSESTEKQFKKFESEDIIIDIVRENAEERFKGFHKFDSNAICVASISALLKFLIPELFPDVDKMLYLDGDLIVKVDVGEIFNYDLENYYVAAVIDSGSMYYKHKYVQKVKSYFNSGVMLLNLEKMRKDNISEELIRVKKELTDSSLMDQNVFNLVFDGKIHLLPIRYNFMPVSLDRANDKWTINMVNELYGTTYDNKKELFSDAAIIHYSSKDKPWKTLDGVCSAEWISYYINAPIKHDLLPIPKERKENYGISVIMPCFNVADIVNETLDSLLAQTFKDYEIICLDDGSTDETLDVLKKYAAQYDNISVFTDSNHRQGYQRNKGIHLAQGKYLYYMDGDDLLDPRCFEIIYKCAEENNLDLLYFEGTPFYESDQLEMQHPEFKKYYNRREAFPKVYAGDELYIKFRNMGGNIVSPCLQLAKRDYILNYFLFFPELPLLEDNLYTFMSLINANRVKCLGDVLFFRRVRENSTMTRECSVEKLKERIEALSFIAQKMTQKMTKYDKGSPMYLAIANHLRGIYSLLEKDVTSLSSDLDEKCLGKTLDTVLSVEQKGIGLASIYIGYLESKFQDLSDNVKRLTKKN